MLFETTITANIFTNVVSPHIACAFHIVFHVPLIPLSNDCVHEAVGIQELRGRPGRVSSVLAPPSAAWYSILLVSTLPFPHSWVLFSTPAGQILHLTSVLSAVIRWEWHQPPARCQGDHQDRGHHTMCCTFPLLLFFSSK